MLRLFVSGVQVRCLVGGMSSVTFRGLGVCRVHLFLRVADASVGDRRALPSGTPTKAVAATPACAKVEARMNYAVHETSRPESVHCCGFVGFSRRDDQLMAQLFSASALVMTVYTEQDSVSSVHICFATSTGVCIGRSRLGVVRCPSRCLPSAMSRRVDDALIILP